MGVLIGVFFGAALLITLAATVLTNVKLWEFIRETPHLYRQLPSEKRRTALAIYGLVACELAVVLIAPFGVRDTLTYFVIVPFVLIIPVAVIATGVRGFPWPAARTPAQPVSAGLEQPLLALSRSLSRLRVRPAEHIALNQLIYLTIAPPAVTLVAVTTRVV